MSGVVGVIQARAGSSRLPGKIFAPLGDRPLLAALAQRLRGARVTRWWLATSAAAEDDVTAAWGEALGLTVHRGPCEDVLARFAAIARTESPRWMVRVCADAPFLDAAIVDRLLAAALSASPEISLVEAPPGLLPLGYAPQVARGDAVLRADAAAAESHHRAHVLTWVAAHERIAKAELPTSWPARPRWRWTIDTAADLAMARAAVEAFGDAWPSADYPTMVRILDARPEIALANAHVPQKAVEEG